MIWHAPNPRRGLVGTAIFLFALAPMPLFAGGPPKNQAKLTGPSEDARETAQAVAKLLADKHLAGLELNEEISRRWLRLFLKRLDPSKLYFNHQDHDEFKKADAAAHLARGELDFAYKIHQRFLERVNERAVLFRELLKKPHDFNVEEERTVNCDQLRFAENDEQTREAWRKFVKYLLMLRRADGHSDDEARERVGRLLETALTQLRSRDDHALLDDVLNCLTESFDPLSRFISPRAWDDFRTQTRQQLIGIGVLITQVDGELVVTRVVPGSPAHKDGRLKTGDKIVGVSSDGSGKIRDVTGMPLADVIALIRGKSDTKVKLEIVQAGQAEPLLYTLTRQSIAAVGVRGATFAAGAPDSPDSFGYIHVPSLYGEVGKKGPDIKSSAGDVRKLLEQFKNKGVDLVLLDLRTNSGGVLSEAIAIADLFIDQGPVMLAKDRAGQVSQYRAENRGAAWDGPLVVLTSKTTASGAEIIVGALQGHGRALIVGESTNGVGTVQNLFDVATAGGLKEAAPRGVLRVTWQQFYAPNGASTQKRGVLPDVLLPWLGVPTPGHAGVDYALDFDRVDALRVDAADFGINQKLRAELAKASLARRKTSAEFQKLDTLRERELERQKRGTVTLNLKEYRESRKGLATDAERIRRVEDGPGVERDFYFNEAAAIASDFLRHCRQRRKSE